MIISLIAAVSKNGVIGKNRGMPWHLPADLKYFYRITRGHHVVMGHRTFHEFGVSKPLPERINLIISTNANLKIEGCIVLNSIKSAIEFALKNQENELFIIGGGNIYKQTIDLADKLYITLIHTSVDDGDTFFPSIDNKKWKITSSDFHKADKKNPFDYDFQILERR